MTNWRLAFKGIEPSRMEDVTRLMGILMNEKIPFSVFTQTVDSKALPTMYVLVQDGDVERVQELGKVFMLCPKLEVTQLRGKSAALCTCGPFDVCPKMKEEVSIECWAIGGKCGYGQRGDKYE